MVSTQTKPDYAAKLALFLLEKTGSVFGEVFKRMTATEQRELFGQFIGKGTIVINGAEETICNQVKVCFGLDSDRRNYRNWRDL